MFINKKKAAAFHILALCCLVSASDKKIELDDIEQDNLKSERANEESKSNAYSETPNVNAEQTIDYQSPESDVYNKKQYAVEEPNPVSSLLLYPSRLYQQTGIKYVQVQGQEQARQSVKYDLNHQATSSAQNGEQQSYRYLPRLAMHLVYVPQKATSPESSIVMYANQYQQKVPGIVYQPHLQPTYQVQQQQHPQPTYQVQHQHSQPTYQIQQQHSQPAYEVQQQQHSQPAYEVQQQQHSQPAYEVQQQQHSQPAYEVQQQQHSQPAYEVQQQQTNDIEAEEGSQQQTEEVNAAPHAAYLPSPAEGSAAHVQPQPEQYVITPQYQEQQVENDAKSQHYQTYAQPQQQYVLANPVPQEQVYYKTEYRYASPSSSYKSAAPQYESGHNRITQIAPPAIAFSIPAGGQTGDTPRVLSQFAHGVSRPVYSHISGHLVQDQYKSLTHEHYKIPQQVMGNHINEQYKPIYSSHYVRKPTSLLDSYIPSSLQIEYLKRGLSKEPLATYDLIANSRRYRYERGFLPNQMYTTPSGGVMFGKFKRATKTAES